MGKEYWLTKDGLLLYMNRVYRQSAKNMKRLIMDELHQIPYFGHPGYQKIIETTRKLYYWHRMKREIVEYYARCLKMSIV